MLKDTQVKNLKPQDKPYRKLDADRLYIEVRPSGKKVWIHKFSLNKKRRFYYLWRIPINISC